MESDVVVYTWRSLDGSTTLTLMIASLTQQNISFLDDERSVNDQIQMAIKMNGYNSAQSGSLMTEAQSNLLQ